MHGWYDLFRKEKLAKFACFLKIRQIVREKIAL